MKRLWICLLLACFSQAAQLDTAAIERAALAELRSTHVPGAAIGIVRDGHLIYAKGFGTSNLETGAPVTPEILFRLGSTTKMMTSAAVVSLAVEGKLDLEAPVGQYIQGLDPAIGKLTANQLLSHTSGLKDEAVMNGPHGDDALGAGIRAWKADWLFTEPGRIYSYANPGFWLAGYLAEVVDGKPYADVMEARVFRRLGMERTTLRPTMAMTWQLSQGHDLVKGELAVLRPAPDNAANWPAGSVFSSVDDLARLTSAIMDGRLGERVIALMTTPHASIPGSKAKYGYGLTLDEIGGLKVWEHGGSRAGYGSQITMLPSRQEAVIVLCNRTGANLPNTRKTILECLGVHQASEPKHAATAVSDEEASEFTGSFRNGASEIKLAIEGHKSVAHVAGKQYDVMTNSDGLLTLNDAQGHTARTLVVVAGAKGNAAYLFEGGRSLKRIQ